MRIKVLGASGSEVRAHFCPAFAVDDVILLDAGTVGLSLNIAEESRIRYILLTHAHFDHIKGLPFLLDNLVTRETGSTVTLVSGEEVIAALKTNILNDRIWPDFTAIPTPEMPVLRYAVIRPEARERINGYSIMALPVSHTVPTYGYILENGEGKAVAYTGDTGPTERFWAAMNVARVRCLITEASFPNRLTEEASRSGHLTPALLEKEIEKMRRPLPMICLVHAKPQHRREIEKEVLALGRAEIRFLREGEILTI